MELEEYLQMTFPGLILKPSLYHQWENALHFEFVREMKSDSYKDGKFNRVHSQALAIFNDLFSEKDGMFLVTNVYHRKRMKRKTKPIKVYQRSIKDKHLKYNVKHVTLPFVFAEEEDAGDYYTSRFSLQCLKRDIRPLSLIKAACNEDFDRKPKFGGINGSYYPDVFFVNSTKNIIFFIYDDRGCEVIAANREVLHPIYKRYNKWVGEDDKAKMERFFE